jgi:hypothetical protein
MFITPEEFVAAANAAHDVAFSPEHPAVKHAYALWEFVPKHAKWPPRRRQILEPHPDHVDCCGRQRIVGYRTLPGSPAYMAAKRLECKVRPDDGPCICGQHV